MNIPPWMNLEIFLGIVGVFLAIISLYYSNKDVFFARKAYAHDNQKANLVVSFFDPKEEVETYFFAFPFDKFPSILITFPVVVANIGEQRAKEIEILFQASNGLIPPEGWITKVNSPWFIEMKTKKTKLNENVTAYAYKINYLGPNGAAGIEFPFLARNVLEHEFDLSEVIKKRFNKEVAFKVAARFAFVFSVEIMCENNISQKVNKQVSLIFINGSKETAIKQFKEENRKLKQKLPLRKRIMNRINNDRSVNENIKDKSFTLIWANDFKTLDEKYKIYALEGFYKANGFVSKGKYVCQPLGII